MYVTACIPPPLPHTCLCVTARCLRHLPRAVEQLPQQPGRTLERSVYLGSEYVNNPTLADITFNVEGRRFHAHRIALLASSDAFRAMFSRGFRVSEGAVVVMGSRAAQGC